jgi:hypothetical protein
MSNYSPYLPAFAELLDELRARGFSLGVEHYLRVQLLLERAGTERTPDEIASLLAPVIAKTPAQQYEFRQVFDEFINGKTAPETSAQTSEKPKPAASKSSASWSETKRMALLALGLAVFLIALIFLFAPKKQTGPGGITGIDPTPVTQIAPEFPPPADPGASPSNIIKRAHWGYYLGAAAVPFLLFLLYESFRRRRRWQALAEYNARQGPVEWPLKPAPRGLDFYDAEPLYAAARQLRRRQADELTQLDMEKSVGATIAAAGFPTFLHRTTSRVPEYLALIHRVSPQDHQARLFALLAKAVEREGVFLRHYFYDGDPRVCVNPQDGATIYLTDLQNRHEGHRLLLFTAGDELLDPLTGRSAAWSNIFAFWPERLLLTPTPAAQWGERENQLAENFGVFPATLTALAEIHEYLESPVKTPLNPFSQDAITLSSQDLTGTPEAVVARLRQKLPQNTLQWLAACAVYPSLQWELTLQLAPLCGPPETLLSESNLLTLCALPYFRRGVMPDELRGVLQQELEKPREEDTRRYLISLMEHDPAPEGSLAEAEQGYQLAVQRWRLQPSKANLRSLLALLQKLPASFARRDAALAKSLAKQNWRLEDTRARLREIFRRVPRPNVTAALKPSFINTLRTVRRPPFSLETAALGLVTVALALIALAGARGLAPRNVEEQIAAVAPTPEALPTPTPLAGPDGLPPYTPPDTLPPPPPAGIAPPMPTPFAANPAPVPLPGPVYVPPIQLPKTGVEPSAQGSPQATGSPLLPALDPPASPTPTPSPTPQVTVALTASQTGVCLGGPATINLLASAKGFAAAPKFAFAANKGTVSPLPAAPSGSPLAARVFTHQWDLSKLPAGNYTATVTATEGALKRSSSLTVKVAQCPCAASVRIVCPTAPVARSPLVLTTELPQVDKNWQARPNFNWAVSGGKVLAGTGTNALTLDVTGAAGQTLQISAEASGFPPQCQAPQPVAATCEITVASALTILVAEFSGGSEEDEKARLDDLVLSVQPQNRNILIEIDSPAEAIEGQPTPKEISERLAKYLATRDIPAKRIKINILPPKPESKTAVRLYSATPGAP